MSRVRSKKRYHISPIILLLFVGSVFTGLGLALVVAGVTRAWWQAGVAILLPLVLIVALLGFGILALRMGIKQIYHWVRLNHTRKHGYDTTARLVGHKVVAHDGTVNKRYALQLVYYEDGVEQTFVTDYLFDVNEFRHLQKLAVFKVRVKGNFVAVTETFDRAVYQVDSHYGISMDFWQQKFVRRTMTACRLVLIPAVIWVFVAMVLTLVLHESLYLLTAVIILPVGSLVFGLMLAVALLKWLRRGARPDKK